MNMLKIELSAVTEQAALICPITGLVTTSNLPALPTGHYLEFTHPLATLAPTLLVSSATVRVSDTESGPTLDRAYLDSLPADLMAGALLACLTHYGKIEYLDGANAYTTRLSMTGSEWSTKGLTKALNWLATRLQAAKLFFKPITVSKESGLTPEVWDAYLVEVAKLDHYTANAEEQGWITLTVEQFVDQQLEANRVSKPKPEQKSKALNSEAYDAYLEFREWLPKRTQDKAKHFIKQLATYYNGELIESFLTGIEVYCSDCPDALTAYNEFTTVVRSVRATATEKGLVDTFDGLVATPTTPVESKSTARGKVSKSDALAQLRARLAAVKGEA